MGSTRGPNMGPVGDQIEGRVQVRLPRFDDKREFCRIKRNRFVFVENEDKNAYSLSRKTVNARENFWNVYCFATNQMRDETAKDNRQTAVAISHDLI